MNINKPDDNVLRLPDIQFGISLGAKWKNYDIEMPDGDIINFLSILQKVRA